ncbi:heterokaryon incompatibility protein-domain-containing protein [Xylariales sp. PMI_506]|nr:heterokaryon incompatibility protein-domain-containing protein [Xylariales sp. PMI_506]
MEQVLALAEISKARLANSQIFSSHSSKLSSTTCETCTQILRLIKGPQITEIKFKNVAQLTQGGLCHVHEDFFQRVQVLKGGQSPYIQNDNPNNSSHIRITKPSAGVIALRGTKDYQSLGELLIASLSGDNPSGSARIVDRKWIDPDLIKSWKTSCELEHGVECCPVSENASNHGHFLRPKLPLFIDTVQECLVDGADKAAYVCLSYVWGRLLTDIDTRTTKETLSAFRQHGAFRQPGGIVLPRTIRDAMNITRLLGERYLWVDALCIIQDDESVRSSLINSMHSIYANAALTIVAADGAHADDGIRGLQLTSCSLPRENPCIFEWPDGTRINWPSSGGLGKSRWNQRGWTFQEYLFSRKRLIFVADSVRWECPKGCFWEEHTDGGNLPTPESEDQYEPDNAPIRRTTSALSPTFPDMVGFKTIVNGFNKRDFTYVEDVMNAITGVLSALTPSFLGGFIWGVPVMDLDLALIWRATLDNDHGIDSSLQETPRSTSEGYRRWTPRETINDYRNAPTWSWVSWRGYIDTGSFWRNEAWLLLSREEWFYNIDPIRRVIPLLHWSLRETKGSAAESIPYQNARHRFKTQYMATDPPAPPPGWTRWPIEFGSDNSRFSLIFDIDIKLSGSGRSSHLDPALDRFPPPYYYTHKSTATAKFCYPVPLRDHVNGKDSQQTANITAGRYLCASTHRAVFNLHVMRDDDGDFEEAHDIRPPGSPPEKDRVGRLWPDESFVDETPEVMPLELVVISATYRANGGERWEQPFGKESPQLYNVLWVEWIDGVAYRKGVGEVDKDVWDAQLVDPIELILG